MLSAPIVGTILLIVLIFFNSIFCLSSLKNVLLKKVGEYQESSGVKQNHLED